VAGNGITVTWSNPVEQVDWTTADTWLSRNGLTLPTEAQWEYGARAGTETPSCFSGASSEHARPAGDNSHWPVGGLAANAFGLHDVFGNVGEWTRDGDRLRGHLPAPGTGLRRDPYGSNRRTLRGFFSTERADGKRVAQCRSAARWFAPPQLRSAGIGIRAARAVDR
jgi:formylglycine-generating enzyme required for sulfatase activity